MEMHLEIDDYTLVFKTVDLNILVPMYIHVFYLSIQRE